MKRLRLITALMALAWTCNLTSTASAVNVLYSDPTGGWFHAFEGNTAYYHDPDGPHPNYLADPDPTITGSDPNGNDPGGAANSPALIPAANEASAIWQISGSNWEGSAPGGPLGGTPGAPPVPAPAPGGVGAYTEGSTGYIRIQDPGQPQNWGWADKGAQGSPTGARQEGNNRRIQFKHEMNRDPLYSDNPAIMDSGVTISFRARISTAATGPLDSIYPEDTGLGINPWPTTGVGAPIQNNGRGMFMITQNGAGGPGQLAFGLNDGDSNTQHSLPTTRTGLVMNNRASGPTGSSPTTGDSTAATLNMYDIPDADLDDWHEFWITVVGINPAANANNTHEVKVYADGSLTPTTFQVILGLQNEFGSGAHLGMGLSSGSGFGAYDIDFFAYREGVVAPTAAVVDDADFDNDSDVDGADFLVWQRGLGVGTTNATGDANGSGSVNAADLAIWKAQFPNTVAVVGAVPEPGSLGLLAIAGGLAAVARRSRR